MYLLSPRMMRYLFNVLFSYLQSFTLFCHILLFAYNCVILPFSPLVLSFSALFYLPLMIWSISLSALLNLGNYYPISSFKFCRYGRYRPWWSPVGKRLKGWQKAWWHYAQESILSDVRRRLRKTSWKYFGERLWVDTCNHCFYSAWKFAIVMVLSVFV